MKAQPAAQAPKQLTSREPHRAAVVDPPDLHRVSRDTGEGFAQRMGSERLAMKSCGYLDLESNRRFSGGGLGRAAVDKAAIGENQATGQRLYLNQVRRSSFGTVVGLAPQRGDKSTRFRAAALGPFNYLHRCRSGHRSFALRPFQPGASCWCDRGWRGAGTAATINGIDQMAGPQANAPGPGLRRAPVRRGTPGVRRRAAIAAAFVQNQLGARSVFKPRSALAPGHHRQLPVADSRWLTPRPGGPRQAATRSITPQGEIRRAWASSRVLQASSMPGGASRTRLFAASFWTEQVE